MKRFLFTVYATVSLGCFLGEAQVIRNASGLTPTNPISTNPANITQFEVSGRLITQNAFVGTTAIPAVQQTGNFGTAARWNSMGSLNAGTQVLNGFRTQTNGRGLTMGYSVPTGGGVSNPTIQWIGNALNGGVTPGNLDFKYALNPGSPGTPQTDESALTIEPVVTPVAPFNFKAYTYARENCLIGQLQSGTYGGFTAADKWVGIGNVNTSIGSFIGSRIQASRGNFIRGIDENGPFFQFAGIGIVPPTLDPLQYNFLRFKGDVGGGNFTDIMKMDVNGKIIMGTPAAVAAPFPIDADFNYNLLVNGKTNINSNLLGVGVYARPSEATAREFAIWAEAFGGQPGKRAFGIYAAVNNPQPFDYAGVFGGEVNINGDLIVNGVTIASDKRLKKDIKSEDNAMAKIMQLKPVSYTYDKAASKWLNLEYEKTSHGFIADEVLEVFPEMIKDFMEPIIGKAKEMNEAKVFKSVNYIQLISVLTKGIQEQQAQIEDLKKQIATTNTVVLSNKANLPTEIENSAFALSQNTPNPFSEKTTISYSIPAGTSKAILAIFDLSGKMLQQYNLQQGKNTLTINGNTLQAGMYIYTLLANGQEVVSKRMVLTK